MLRTLSRFYQKAATFIGIPVCESTSQWDESIEGESASSEKRYKTIVGRDWLTALRYKIVHATEEGENLINCVSEEKVKPEVELSAEVKHLKRQFPDLFERRGRVKDYLIKTDMKKGTRVTQQKSRRIPIQ